MDKKSMKKISVQIQEVNGTLMVPIPEAVAEMMDLDEDIFVKVPFHEFETVMEEEDYISEPQEDGKKEVTVKIKTNTTIVTQKDVIDLLNSPTPDLKVYRTAYISWKGERYGIKNVCKKLFGFNDFNTIQGESYLNELGFVTGRE